MPMIHLLALKDDRILGHLQEPISIIIRGSGYISYLNKSVITRVVMYKIVYYYII